VEPEEEEDDDDDDDDPFEGLPLLVDPLPA
jgi:hypothetical protein